MYLGYCWLLMGLTASFMSTTKREKWILSDRISTKGTEKFLKITLQGVIQQLRGQNFTIFWPPPPVWIVSLPWAWTKADISWPHVHVVIEWPPSQATIDRFLSRSQVNATILDLFAFIHYNEYWYFVISHLNDSNIFNF